MMAVKEKIHYIIILLIMLGGGFLPAPGDITPYGMQILAIFFGLVYAWTVNIVFWPTLFSMLLFATVQHQAFNVTLGGIIGNPAGIQVAVVLVYCYALEACGLMDWLGQWLLHQKLITKGPYWLLATFWFIGFVAAAFTLNSINVVIMMWVVWGKVSAQAGIKPYSAFSNSVIIGLAVISYIGSTTFPFAMWPQCVFGIYASALGTVPQIPYGLYIGLSLLLGAMVFIVGLLITKFIIRPKIDFDLSQVKFEGEAPKMNTVQKFAAGSIVFMIAFLLAPVALPAGLQISTWMTQMGMAGIMLAVTILLAFFKDEKTGKPVMTLDKVLQYGLNYRTFLMLCIAFYAAGLITSEATGVFSTVMNVIQPLVMGKGMAVTIFIIMFVAAVITNCMNNVVCTSMIVPLVIILAPVLNLNATVVLIGLCHVLIQGCALPSGSAVGALLHGNKEWVTSGAVYKYATLFTGLVALAASVICILFS